MGWVTSSAASTTDPTEGILPITSPIRHPCIPTCSSIYYSLCSRHYRNRVLCRVSKTLGKDYFTLGKEHSTIFLSAKGSLPSTFFRTLGKDFAECRKALGKLRIEKNKKK
jgi:hypothetical protein